MLLNCTTTLMSGTSFLSDMNGTCNSYCFGLHWIVSWIILVSLLGRPHPSSSLSLYLSPTGWESIPFSKCSILTTKSSNSKHKQKQKNKQRFSNSLHLPLMVTPPPLLPSKAFISSISEREEGRERVQSQTC